MFSTLKKINPKAYFSASDSRTIVRNSFFLLLIQGTNVILPLVLVPYLISVLGLEKFGLLSFAQSFISFWIIFADYGFQVSATREVALNKGDKDKLSSIVNNTLKTKLLLCAFAFLVYCGVVYFIPTFSKYSSFYLLTFVMVVGQSLVPTWFFQGVEQMHFLAYLNFASKAIFTSLIFILIKQPADITYVTLLYGLGNLIAGIAGTYIMFRSFSIPFKLFKRYNLLEELKKGWYVFISNFSTNTYLNFNTLFLGFFAGEAIVGFYSIAEKVVYVLKLLISIFFQATFPKACQQKEKGHEHLESFFKRYSFPFTLFIAFLSVVLALSADQITFVLTGSYVQEISWSIRVLCIIPVAVSLNTPASQTLLSYDFQKSYMKVILCGAVINILLNVVLVKQLLIRGTVFSVTLTELFITVGLYTILHFQHHQFSLLKLKRVNRNV